MLRTPSTRLGLVLTAVFQLLLPTFASVADARAEAASVRGAVTHVESHGTPKCVPVHAADCAVCRVIAGGATAARPPAIRAASLLVIEAPAPKYVRIAISASSSGDPSQRAPPVV